jgi:hypothetical protein
MRRHRAPWTPDLVLHRHFPAKVSAHLVDNNSRFSLRQIQREREISELISLGIAYVIIGLHTILA